MGIREETPGLWPATAWTLIRNAHGADEAEKRSILDDLFRRYRDPVAAYFHAKRAPHDRVDDLVQGFFLHFLEKNAIKRAQQEKGRFRDLLMKSARNYLVDQVRRDASIIHGGRHKVQSLQDDRTPYEPADKSTPADAFHDGYRRSVLQRAQESVVALCTRRGRETDFLVFRDYYMCDEPSRWVDVAQRYGVTHWKTAARMADWVKEQFKRAIRDELSFDLGDDPAGAGVPAKGHGPPSSGDRRMAMVTDNDIDNELRDLMA